MRGAIQTATATLLLAVVVAVHGGEIAYSYDSVNRLISATHNTTGSVATFSFDAAGNIRHEGRRVDSDGDDMPDQWEILMFGSIGVSDGTGDYDDDGVSDLDEYYTGTDPDDASSRFAFGSGGGLATGPGTNTLTWASASNRTYKVEHTTNLLDGFTATLATGIEGAPGTNAWTHSTTNPVNFYRVTQEDE